MNLTFLLEVILIFLLILLSGFFAASEIAVIAVRKSRIRQLVEEGNPRAVFVEKLRKDPDKFFAMIQIGITVSGSAASALGSLAGAATAGFVLVPSLAIEMVFFGCGSLLLLTAGLALLGGGRARVIGSSLVLLAAAPVGISARPVSIRRRLSLRNVRWLLIKASRPMRVAAERAMAARQGERRFPI